MIKNKTMKIKLTIEVEIDTRVFGVTKDDKLWLENEILVGDGNLTLHSDEVGDTVGIVKSVKGLKFISE